MTKHLVTRLFVGGTVAVLAGVVFTLVALWLAIAGGAFVFTASGGIGVNGGMLAWGLLGVAIGAVAIIGGSIVWLISWIGALLNTGQLEDKTWFVILLVLGVFSFGFLAMVAYVIAGPDSTVQPLLERGVATAQ